MASAELLEEIRKEAKPGIWTSGVNLARNGAVALQARNPGEVELRVRAPGRTVPLTVILYPDDASWECDCPGRLDPCEHVCAAAIALQKAESHDGGQLATTAAKWTRVVYRFARAEGGGLKLQRALVEADGTERPLEPSLAALMARPAEAARLQVEQHDLIADRLLERPTRVALVPEKLDALLRVLQPARTVLLDGQPVVISDETIVPRAVVEDRGSQIVVTLTRDPRIDEVVSPGVARCGDALCRLGELELSGARLEKLPVVRAYPAEQIAELTARVLPELARRGLPLDVRSRRLPRIDRELRPHIALELTRIDAGLSVLPTLVYGSPPQVRIDNGRMVYLRGAVPVRDEAREQALIQRLRDELNLVAGRRATFTEGELLRFADKARRFGGVVSGDAAGLLSPNVTLRPTLELTSGVSGSGLPEVAFDLRFQVEGEGSGGGYADAAEVIRAWREGLGLVPIEGGGWAPLPRAWLDQHGERVAQLLAARAQDGKVAAHALPELGALCEALERPPPPGLDRLAPLVRGFDQLPEPTLPADLTASLRPYQLQGVAWLSFLRSAGLGGILADDMGLGKTLQTICVLGPGSLVVCPTSVLPNWQAELARFRPSLKVNTYHGPSRALDSDADVTLTTYAILRLDHAALCARSWAAVVLDEAQAIKNPDSQAARAAFALKADFRLALSGTPMENRLEELWSLMHFANPGLLGGRRDFEERVARPVSEGRPGVAEGLRRRIRPFVLRRLKKEVAKDLPPRTESVRRVTLDERERAVYDAVYAATRAEVVRLLSDGGSGGVMKALEALLRLRQAACHSALVPGQQARTSSKVTSLVEALTTAVSDGHKALVFSQWTSLLDLIEPALKDAQIAFERLDGTTQNRGEVTARIQADDGAPVMLVSLKAGGTGLNLTAADHVFLMDPWWNPAVEAQAADRAHRIGQERPVFVYRMIAQGTIEERILGLQDRKRALFEAALGEAGAAAALTREDLLELFADAPA